jgi:hypothetical protein
MYVIPSRLFPYNHFVHRHKKLYSTMMVKLIKGEINIKIIAVLRHLTHSKLAPSFVVFKCGNQHITNILPNGSDFIALRFKKEFYLEERFHCLENDVWH